MKNETINNNTTTNNQTMNESTLKYILDRYGIPVEKAMAEIKAANLETVEAKEKGAMARVDTFSDEKGRELNKQYGDYLEGSVKENFDKQIDINNQKLSLEEAKLQIKLQRMESEAGMKIQKMFFDADLELQKKKDELKRLGTSKLKYWVWRIFWPLLGAGAGTLAFYLLYILK